MLVLLTPSKTMDFETPTPGYIVPTTPPFAGQAGVIRYLLARYDQPSLQSLMRISPTLAERVQAMYRSHVYKPAFWTYHGDVFKGIKAQTLTQDDARFAQRHILVPSAVYGLLRPMDEISPYRLEMSAKLAVEGSSNLYEFWGEQLAQYVASYRQYELLILSSLEYSRAITKHLLPDIRVVTPVFLDVKGNGQIGQVPIYNKMMRGVMARWIIDQRIDRLEDITSFEAHGYSYDAERSAPNSPAYYREVMTPLVFT